MSATQDAAEALAAEFLDEPSEPVVPLIDQLTIEETPILWPGMDWREKVLYYTYPAFHNTTEVQGKGKKAKEVPVINTYTLCIGSDRDHFMYEPEELFKRGFRPPEAYIPQKQGWLSHDAKRFSTGDTVAPEPWDLYMRIRRVYEQYVEFADERYYDVMALWVMSSYVFKVFQSFSYLHFNGTKETGKSQNLRILKAIGYNTSWSLEMTAADMFRGLANNPGIMCIDEAEKWEGERGQALTSILRSGYASGTYVTRQRKRNDERWEQDVFPVYSPKALASIAPMDATTTSRAIVVQMRPALRAIPKFNELDDRWAGVRNDLRLFGLYNAREIADHYERWDTLRLERAPSLINRSWEISAHLIATADFLAGDQLVAPLVDWLTKYFLAQRKTQDSTDIIRLLALSLPTVLRQEQAHPGWLYPLKTVLETMKVFMDLDSTERLNTRGMLKWLIPLGFSDIRSDRGGRLIRIDENDLRAVFRERRIEPRPEDEKWLAEEESYQTPNKEIQPMQTQVSWD